MLANAIDKPLVLYKTVDVCGFLETGGKRVRKKKHVNGQ